MRSQASTSSERDLVARLFNHLVTPSGTKSHTPWTIWLGTPGRATSGSSPCSATLDAARILRRVPGRGGGPPRYEIFHDVLAPAVLAWRDRHEAERRERAEWRERRHRRLAVVAMLALVALAGTLGPRRVGALAAIRGAGPGDARALSRAGGALAVTRVAAPIPSSSLLFGDGGRARSTLSRRATSPSSPRAPGPLASRRDDDQPGASGVDRVAEQAGSSSRSGQLYARNLLSSRRAAPRADGRA